MRDAKLTKIYEGTNEIQWAVIVRARLSRTASLQLPVVTPCPTTAPRPSASA